MNKAILVVLLLLLTLISAETTAKRLGKQPNRASRELGLSQDCLWKTESISPSGNTLIKAAEEDVALGSQCDKDFFLAGGTCIDDFSSLDLEVYQNVCTGETVNGMYVGIRGATYECNIETCDDAYIWCPTYGTRTRCESVRGCYWDNSQYGNCFGKKELSCDSVVSKYTIVEDPHCVSPDCPCNEDMEEHLVSLKTMDVENPLPGGDWATTTCHAIVSGQNPKCLPPSNPGDNTVPQDCATETQRLSTSSLVKEAQEVVNNENQCQLSPQTGGTCEGHRSSSVLNNYRQACLAAGGVYMGLNDFDLSCEIRVCDFSGVYCSVHMDGITCGVAPGCVWSGYSCVGDSSCRSLPWKEIYNEFPQCIGATCSCDASMASSTAQTIVSNAENNFSKQGIQASCVIDHSQTPTCSGNTGDDEDIDPNPNKLDNGNDSSSSRDVHRVGFTSYWLTGLVLSIM